MSRSVRLKSQIIIVFLTLLPFGCDSSQLTIADQNDAVGFCRDLFEHIKTSRFSGYMSFDTLPDNFRNTAPKAIQGLEFRIQKEVEQSSCCFRSTETGNFDFGYVDCLSEKNGITKLETKIKFAAYSNGCSEDGKERQTLAGVSPQVIETGSRISRVHGFRGKSSCVQIGNSW